MQYLLFHEVFESFFTFYSTFFTSMHHLEPYFQILFSIKSQQAFCRPSECYFHSRKHSVARQSTLSYRNKHPVARQSTLSNRASTLSPVRELHPTAQALCRPSEYSILSQQVSCRPSEYSILSQQASCRPSEYSIPSKQALCRQSEYSIQLRKHPVGRQNA